MEPKRGEKGKIKKNWLAFTKFKQGSKKIYLGYKTGVGQ